MEMGTTRALRGPNIWSQATVLETTVDLTRHLQLTPNDVDVVRGRAGRMLAGVVAPLPSSVHPGASHSPRLILSELLVRTALELQTQAGSPVSLGRVAETKEAGQYKCVVQYREEIGRASCRERV